MIIANARQYTQSYSALLQTEEGLSCNTEKDKGKKLNYHTAGISCSSCIIMIIIIANYYYIIICRDSSWDLALRSYNHVVRTVRS